MTCLECGGDSRVVYTTYDKAGRIKRRRECLKCKERWGTVEVPADELAVLLGIKAATIAEIMAAVNEVLEVSK